MSIDVVCSENPDKDWDNRITEATVGAWGQSVEHAEYKKYLLGEKPLFYTAHSERGKVIGQLLVMKSWAMPFHTAHNPRFRWALPVVKSMAPNWYWRSGPIIMNIDSNPEDIVASIVKKVMNDAANAGASIRHATANIYAGDQLHKTTEDVIAELGWTQVESRTNFMIDLSQGEESILSGMDKTRRYDVKRFLRDPGYTVFIMNASQTYENAEAMANQIREIIGNSLIHYGVPQIPQETDKLGRMFFENTKNQGALTTDFLVSYNSTPGAALRTVTWNNVMLLGDAGLSEWGRKAKGVFCGEGAYWSAIAKAIQMQCVYFDLSVTYPYPDNSLYKFKQRWGSRKSELAFSEMPVSGWRKALWKIGKKIYLMKR